MGYGVWRQNPCKLIRETQKCMGLWRVWVMTGIGYGRVDCIRPKIHRPLLPRRAPQSADVTVLHGDQPGDAQQSHNAVVLVITCKAPHPWQVPPRMTRQMPAFLEYGIVLWTRHTPSLRRVAPALGGHQQQCSTIDQRLKVLRSSPCA